MTTELENHNNLQSEQKPTEETISDSVNIDSSEVVEPLVEEASTDSIDTNETGGEPSSDIEPNPAQMITEDQPEGESLASEVDASTTESLESKESLDSDSEVINQAEITILALRAEIESLKTQLEAQKSESQSLNGQYMRLNADFENFRRRTSKEKEDLEQRIKIKTLSELLSVVDNFERARTQLKPANDGEKAIHKSYQGVYKTLVDSFKRLGVSAMRPEGKPFDPNYHEAMLREPNNEYPEGTVLEQMVRGYLLNDQVLRHAMVKVSTPKDDEDETPDSDPSSLETTSENNH